MSASFWFNRMVEYWSIPTQLDLADLVRRGGTQLVQAGTFGPQFYSLADDSTVDRNWVGMPLVGIEENLGYARGVIAAVQGAGARFVGQMSMSWNYGDHELGKGLFGVWDRLWTPQLLGPAPAAGAAETLERAEGGGLRSWPIPGRPYRTYSGCFCNPGWLGLLKAMAAKAIELGVDGLMVHHNFSSFCRCGHCRAYLAGALAERFSPSELTELFGTADLQQGGGPDLVAPRPECAAALRQRFGLELNRLTHHRRKEAFDEVYVAHARSLQPGLLLSQWYHKYDFGPGDERSLLPPGVWARDEDYIWYSQGGHKGTSALDQGYLADMGLPARFVLAAGAGRPFVINKYDYRRLRLSIAEAAANGAAAPAFHIPSGVDGGPSVAQDEYRAALVRYHRFVADRQDLYHPARPWAPLALVYPRRGELLAEGNCLDAIKRTGRVLEDGHVLFDMVLDTDLLTSGGGYGGLVLAGTRWLTPEEGEWLRRYAEQGGRLVLAGPSGTHAPDGTPHPHPLLAPWAGEGPGISRGVGAGTVLRYPDGPWAPGEAELPGGARVPAYPPPERDDFGHRFRQDLAEVLGGFAVETDAPWFVRLRAWLPASGRALVLHWVNYHQDERAGTEVPWPTGPIEVGCRLPEGRQATGVEWLYPEMGGPEPLPTLVQGERVRFVVPRVIVYGLAVVHFATEEKA
ncbi:MAG: hypothetical protein AB1505_14385 [Candidatus Latescibacterota bacterium]